MWLEKIDGIIGISDKIRVTVFVCVAQMPYRILQVSWILFLSHPNFGEGKVGEFP